MFWQEKFKIHCDAMFTGEKVKSGTNILWKSCGFSALGALLNCVHLKTETSQTQNRLLLFSWNFLKNGQADVEQEAYFLMGKREKVLGNVFWWKVLWGNFGAGQGRCHKEEERDRETHYSSESLVEKTWPCTWLSMCICNCTSNQRSRWTELFCHVKLFVQRWRDLAGGSNIVKW